MVDSAYNDLKILAFIPARANSKGITHKHLRRLNGKPVISYSIESALRSRLINRVIVSTDSPQIAQLSRQLGAEVPYLRPRKLAGDQSNIGDTVAHLMQHLFEEEGYVPDLFVSLLPTNPFRGPELIDSMLAQFLDDKKERIGKGRIVQILACAPNYYSPNTSFVMKGEKLEPLCRYLNVSQPKEEERTYMVSGSVGPHVYSEEQWLSAFQKKIKHIPPTEAPNGKDRWYDEITGEQMLQAGHFLSDVEGIELDEPIDLFAAIAVGKSNQDYLS